MIAEQIHTTEDLWNVLETISDPEIPVISIIDLGIVRDAKLNADGSATVTITPTYSGCPAMNMIAMDIRVALAAAGIRIVEIKNQLSPAWTTEWLTEEGREKLRKYGIAPPVDASPFVKSLYGENPEEHVECPHCHSHNTEMVSRFGSTSCKALYKCNDCKEPFDYFKCH